MDDDVQMSLMTSKKDELTETDKRSDQSFVIDYFVELYLDQVLKMSKDKPEQHEARQEIMRILQLRLM